MSDDGLREIQLNGKQLVFLFMTATVVAVVIFLCGVLVGQGVRAQQTLRASTSGGVGADPTALPGAPAITPTVPSTGAAPAETGPLDYPRILGEGPDLPVERLTATAPAPAAPAAERVPAPTPERRPAAQQTRPTAPAARPAAASAPASARPPATAATGRSEPAGSGFVVQVAAVREKEEADAMARRLTAKGYPAFVTSPANGPARVFRVRVGRYTDRREAESIAVRLEREEQFKPWITR